MAEIGQVNRTLRCFEQSIAVVLNQTQTPNNSSSMLGQIQWVPRVGPSLIIRTESLFTARGYEGGGSET